METFTEAKKFVSDPNYLERRVRMVKELERAINGENIDLPLVDLLLGYNSLPYCFTLQSCYGHFVYDEQRDPKNTDPIPRPSIPNPDAGVEYRIAYMAVCFRTENL